MAAVVVNARIIYKKKVNVRMSSFHFKVIFAESLIYIYSCRKRKFTSEQPPLALELPQALKEPAHIVLLH